MKKIVTVLLVVLAYSVNAQTVDYNIQKGYIAEGYDVVSYFENKAIEGSSKLITTHEGVKYMFSSKENLDTFNSNPTKYVPQYGGWCSYALGAKNKKISIDPETYEIRDGKLYLFYNSWGINALKKWKKTPLKLKEKADKNWNQLKFKK